MSSAYQPSVKGNNRDVVLMQDGVNPPSKDSSTTLAERESLTWPRKDFKSKPDLETRESLLEKK